MTNQGVFKIKIINWMNFRRENANPKMKAKFPSSFRPALDAVAREDSRQDEFSTLFKQNSFNPDDYKSPTLLSNNIKKFT